MNTASAPRITRDEPTLLDAASTILRHRILIIRLTLVLALLGAIMALASTRKYTADFSFTPQESSATGGLSAIASDFGVNIGANESQSPDFYMDLIHTREVVWRLLDAKFTIAAPTGPVSFILLDTIMPTGSSRELRRDRAAVKLRKAITARANLKTSVVSVSVTATSAPLALEIAERLIVEINRFNSETRRSRAAAQRAFAEQRVAEARVALRSAEDRSEAWLTRNRIFAASAELQYEKTRLDRDLGLRDGEYVAIMQQLRSARMEEVRNTPVITIVERPTLPARPNGRGVVSKTALGGFLGFILALILVFLRESLRRTGAARDDRIAEFTALRSEFAHDLRHPKQAVRQLLLLPKGPTLKDAAVN